jgi:hypothetical protein
VGVAGLGQIRTALDPGNVRKSGNRWIFQEKVLNNAGDMTPSALSQEHLFPAFPFGVNMYDEKSPWSKCVTIPAKQSLWATEKHLFDKIACFVSSVNRICLTLSQAPEPDIPLLSNSADYVFLQ